MLKTFRNAFETEDGQAIIIGALMMLILAFGLMVTLNIGTTVQEKIRLQNNSDAAAYSLAVTEAQAFNYIAFTNRVQAAHYNMIMTIQTYQGMFLLFESIFGTILDVVWTLYTIFFWVPYLGKILKFIAKIVGWVLTGLKIIMYGTVKGEPKAFALPPFYNLITAAGYAKQGIWYLNYAHYIANLIVAGAVWLKIANNMNSLIHHNDSRINMSFGDGNFVYKALNLVLNGYEYLSTFDKYAGGVPPIPSVVFKDAIHGKKRKKGGAQWDKNDGPYTRSEHAKFRNKIMGEIANASRSTTFNTKRDNHKHLLGSMINFGTIGVTKLISTSPRILENKPDGAGKLIYYNMMDSGGDNMKYENGVLPEMRRDGELRSAGSSGDIVASDQGYYLDVKLGVDIPILGFLGIKYQWGMGTYMWSDNYGGNYWRWATPDKNITGICTKGDNKKCMENHRKKLKAKIGYIRIPVSIWDFMGPVKDFIEHVRRRGLLGIGFRGCDLDMHKVGGKGWDKDNYGPRVNGWDNYHCSDRGSCKWPVKWGCCRGFARMACNIEGALKRRLQTHEVVNHDTNAQQYYFGISPYIKFKPKSDRRADFNQPSTFMLLNLQPEHFMDNQPWSFKQNKDILGTQGSAGNDHGSGWNEHKKQLEGNIDAPAQTTLSTDPVMHNGNRFSTFRPLTVLNPGLNAMTRARVYYHRPGNWNEHPNFFNPYWRAQLAPIAPKINGLLSRVLKMDNEVSSNATNGGFLGDLSSIKTKLQNSFGNLISRIITH